MFDQFIKNFAGNLEQVSTKFGKFPAAEIQAQLQQVAKSTLTKMDLVTREEFDVQAAMLLAYRERIVQLEAKMQELEQNIKTQGE